jgi:hypothetical protein
MLCITGSCHMGLSPGDRKRESIPFKLCSRIGNPLLMRRMSHTAHADMVPCRVSFVRSGQSTGRTTRSPTREAKKRKKSLSDTRYNQEPASQRSGFCTTYADMAPRQVPWRCPGGVRAAPRSCHMGILHGCMKKRHEIRSKRVGQGQSSSQAADKPLLSHV